MADVAFLVKYIRDSQMTEAMKEDLTAIIQVASPEDRERIYTEVKAFNEKIIRIRRGVEPLTVDDIIFIRGVIEDYIDHKNQAQTGAIKSTSLF